MKPNVPVVLGPSARYERILSRVQHLQCPLVLQSGERATSLPGAHQRSNAAIAAACAGILGIDQGSIETGLMCAVHR